LIGLDGKTRIHHAAWQAEQYCSALDAGQQVGGDRVRVRRRHAVRESLAGFQPASLRSLVVSRRALSSLRYELAAATMGLVVAGEIIPKA
jgi:hypothetical protein